jgi:hypothetical protein
MNGQTPADRVGISVKGTDKWILGNTERKLLEAYLNGERLKGYNTVLWRIRAIGLKAIIEGCERDLTLLRRLMKLDL